ncbi:DUF2177 family protein [Variovorax sp. OV329]|uniref:DUF2177 family protein n=1 Tax=Variovorax sp. OV329 TaxID=1882825 RepID=UPI0008DED69D|nr:DUF2177 family protein [Variovorax sp. OV329]SFN41648.1 Uncharacterized membrane protein [Variovorax sp. OV329]
MNPPPHNTLRSLAIAWLLAAALFLAMDAVWLSLMTPRLYRPEIGGLMRESVDLLAALLFYLLYISGMVMLAIAPALAQARPGGAAWRGALLGLVAYGAYDLTNQATLTGWPWRVTLADLAWGCGATAVAAGLACKATLAIGRRHAARRDGR